jgi:hypothetical protein
VLPSTAACLRFERESFGALHQMLAGLDEEEQEQTWAEVESALSVHETASEFVGPCELHVVSGAR